MERKDIVLLGANSELVVVDERWAREAVHVVQTDRDTRALQGRRIDVHGHQRGVRRDMSIIEHHRRRQSSSVWPG